MVTRFGNLLRTKREQLGLSLQDVAHKTRIPVASLIALEEEDYDAVGSHVYSSGFLRLYCTFLGLDPAAAPEHWRARPPTICRSPMRITGSASARRCAAARSSSTSTPTMRAA